MANWIFCSLPYLTLLRVLCWFLILHLTFTLIPPGSQSRPTCLSYRLFLGDLKTLNTTYILKVKVKSLSRVRLCGTPWTVAYQAPQSMEFSRQEYWNGLSFSSPGDLPNPGIEPRSPTLQTDALPSEPPGKPIYILMTIKSWCRALIAP